MTYLEGGEVVQPGAVKQAVERLRLPGERSEFMVTGPHHSPASEDKTRDELPAKTEGEVHQEAISEATRKTTHGKFLWVAGLALVTVLVGLALLLGREGNPPQDRKVETLAEKRSQEGNASQAEIEPSKEQGMGGTVALPLSEGPLLKKSDKALNPSAEKKASVGAGQDHTTPRKPALKPLEPRTRKFLIRRFPVGRPGRSLLILCLTHRSGLRKKTTSVRAGAGVPAPTTGSSVRENLREGDGRGRTRKGDRLASGKT